MIGFPLGDANYLNIFSKNLLIKWKTLHGPFISCMESSKLHPLIGGIPVGQKVSHFTDLGYKMYVFMADRRKKTKSCSAMHAKSNPQMNFILLEC